MPRGPARPRRLRAPQAFLVKESRRRLSAAARSLLPGIPGEVKLNSMSNLEKPVEQNNTAWRNALKDKIAAAGKSLPISEQAALAQAADAKIDAIARSQDSILAQDEARSLAQSDPDYRKALAEREQKTSRGAAAFAAGAAAGALGLAGAFAGEACAIAALAAAAPFAIAGGIALGAGGAGYAFYQNFKREQKLSDALNDPAKAKYAPDAERRWQAGALQEYELRKSFYQDAEQARKDSESDSAAGAAAKTYGIVKIAGAKTHKDAATGLGAIALGAAIDLPAHRSARARFNAIPEELRKNPEPPK